jgi:hypothetical protein
MVTVCKDWIAFRSGNAGNIEDDETHTLGAPSGVARARGAGVPWCATVGLTLGGCAQGKGVAARTGATGVISVGVRLPCGSGAVPVADGTEPLPVGVGTGVVSRDPLRLVGATDACGVVTVDPRAVVIGIGGAATTLVDVVGVVEGVAACFGVFVDSAEEPAETVGAGVIVLVAGNAEAVGILTVGPSACAASGLADAIRETTIPIAIKKRTVAMIGRRHTGITDCGCRERILRTCTAEPIPQGGGKGVHQERTLHNATE